MGRCRAAGGVGHEHCRCMAQGIQELRRRLLGGGCQAANNTCFLECEEFLFIDTVLLLIKPPRARENWSCATCVNVVIDAVERLGCCGAGPQQCREFLEQLLNLGRKNGNACLRAPGFNERRNLPWRRCGPRPRAKPSV
jgi:hypothetical protein